MKKNIVIFLLLMTLCCGILPVAAEESGNALLVQYQTIHSSVEESTLSNASGMGYVMRAENGELFVIDGGVQDDGYRFLQLLKAVSGQDKPHVSLWFLSHPHADHYGALSMIANQYADQITVDRILAAFPPADTVDLVKGTSYAPGMAALNTILYTFRSELIVPHAGDTCHVGNMDIDVVTTWEDLRQINECNETSTILMVYAAGQKVLFLGDAYAATCKNAVKKYGDRLKCDIVQCAHHAVCGGSVELYKAADAGLHLIPNNRTTVDIQKKKDSVVYWLINNVQEILYAGDGTVYITLSPDGVTYTYE